MTNLELLIERIESMKNITYVIDDDIIDEHFVLDITNGSYSILTYWSDDKELWINGRSKYLYIEMDGMEQNDFLFYLQDKFNIIIKNIV